MMLFDILAAFSTVIIIVVMICVALFTRAWLKAYRLIDHDREVEKVKRAVADFILSVVKEDQAASGPACAVCGNTGGGNLLVPIMSPSESEIIFMCRSGHLDAVFSDAITGLPAHFTESLAEVE